MDEIKMVYDVLDELVFSAAGCKCTVICPGVPTNEAESLIVVIKPPEMN